MHQSWGVHPPHIFCYDRISGSYKIHIKGIYDIMDLEFSGVYSSEIYLFMKHLFIMVMVQDMRIDYIESLILSSQRAMRFFA